MTNVRLISPAANLLDEVMHSFQPDGVDYSAHLVVFPGKRPAHVLRKKLADKMRTPFVPPKIFSVDIFIDYLFTEHLHKTERTVDSLDAAALLYSLYSALSSEKKINEHYFTSLDTFYPVARLLFSELEELYIAGVRQQQLREATATVELPSTAALVELYEHFYDELIRQRRTTRSMKYRYVAEHWDEIDVSRYRKIILAGFYAFTQTEELLLKKIIEQPNSELIVQNGIGIKRQLEKLGISIDAEPEASTPEYHFYRSPDAHGQMFALNTVLKKHLPAMVQASDDSVIVLPSADNLFPLYHQTLAQFDRDSYNIALGYPLHRTPISGFLLALMEVVIALRRGNVLVPAYLQFMLHPYTKNILWKTRSDVTRILVHAIEQYCTDHNTKTYFSLDEVETNPTIREIVQRRLAAEQIALSADDIQTHLEYIHNNTLKKFFALDSIGALGAKSIEVVQFIYEHSTAHRHPFFRPFVETLLQHLEALPHSQLAGERFSKPEHYYAFLKEYITEAEVPFTGTPLQGLQVLGLLETRGLKYNNVYILDANDDVLPGGSQQDVMLPLAIRQRLGLSTYNDQEQIKRYIFETLCAGAKHVHCFFIENDTKIKSRFIERLLWETQKRTRLLDDETVQRVQYNIDLSIRQPQPVEKTLRMCEQLKQMTFSSTSLDTYLTCPLQFYYRYVLRLKEKEEISGEVERTDVGTIIHQILHEYFLPLKGKLLTVNDLDKQRLASLINDVFRRYYGEDLLGEQFITQRQVTKHLMEFFDAHQTPLVSNETVVIESLEEKLSVDVEGRKFEGKTDRIEQRGGVTYILDYKTGSNEKHVSISFKKLNAYERSTWNDAIGSVQLPLYMMMYSQIAKIPADAITPAIIFLGKKQLTADAETRLFDTKEEVAVWFPIMEKIILSLVDEILDVNTPFVPTDDIVNNCPECPFKFICGTQWAVKYDGY